MRRERDVTIESAGRDQGKRFRLTEMGADQAERWAFRLMMGMTNAGADIPVEILMGGLAGFKALTYVEGVKAAQSALKALLAIPAHELEPLMAEMFGCVTRLEDVAGARALVQNDTEEVSTRVFLRGEVIQLHLGFSIGEWLSNLKASKPPIDPSPDAKTSPKTSPRSSHREKRV